MRKIHYKYQLVAQMLLLFLGVLLVLGLSGCTPQKRVSENRDTQRDTQQADTTIRFRERIHIVRDCTHISPQVQIDFAIDSLPGVGRVIYVQDSATGALLRFYQSELGKLTAQLKYQPPPIIIREAFNNSTDSTAHYLSQLLRETQSTTASTEIETVKRRQNHFLIGFGSAFALLFALFIASFFLRR